MYTWITADRKLNDWLENTDDKAIQDLEKEIFRASRLMSNSDEASRDLRDKILNELRESKASQAAMRAAMHPTRSLLGRLWQFLQAKETELPINLMNEYQKLQEADPYIQPAPRAAASSGRFDKPIKTETKQDQSEGPKPVMRPSETVVEETPSVRLQTPGSATLTGEGVVNLTRPVSRNNHAGDSGSETRSADLRGWTSKVWGQAAAKRRNSGEVGFDVKRTKMEQDSTASVLQAPRHTEPRTETGNGDLKKFVWVKREE